jgi:hypothetical protein
VEHQQIVAHHSRQQPSADDINRQQVNDLQQTWQKAGYWEIFICSLHPMQIFGQTKLNSMA